MGPSPSRTRETARSRRGRRSRASDGEGELGLGYGPLRDARFLTMDRDTKFTTPFKAALRREGVKPVLCPQRTPNCNPSTEWFVRPIKKECLAKVIPVGTGSLRHSLHEYLSHYHLERNHQGLSNRLIGPTTFTPSTKRTSVCKHERLGGILNHYYRLAAYSYY